MLYRGLLCCFIRRVHFHPTDDAEHQASESLVTSYIIYVTYFVFIWFNRTSDSSFSPLAENQVKGMKSFGRYGRRQERTVRGSETKRERKGENEIKRGSWRRNDTRADPGRIQRNRDTKSRKPGGSTCGSFPNAMRLLALYTLR